MATLTHFEFSFIADGSVATLRFADLTANQTVSLDGILDNASVIGPAVAPVPEPHFVTLLGLGLAGLGFSRRRLR